MAIILHIILSWFMVTYFVLILPRKDLVKNIILYMLLLILTVSISTELALNLGLIRFTTDKIKYIAVALCRNIITPWMLVIFCDIFKQLKTYPKKITSIILILLVNLLLEFINMKLHLYTFVRWSYMLHLLLYTFYIFIALVLNKGLYAFQKSGELNR